MPITHWITVPRRLIRIAIFLAFLIVAVILGSLWHHNASEDKRSTLPELKVPLYVDIWTSQPSLPVTVNVIVVGKALGSPLTAATVDVKPPSKNVSVALTSSVPTLGCYSPVQEIPSSGMPKSGIGVLPYGYTATEGSNVICRFKLNRDSITYDGKVVQARLPVVSEATSTPRQGTTNGLAGEVEANGITYQFAYDLKTTEALLNLGAMIAADNDDVTINFPSSGTPEGYAFTWQGGTDLAPEVRAVPRDLEDNHDNDEFLSGIAFATAAAAAVALAQEIPEEEKAQEIPEEEKAQEIPEEEV